MAIKKIRISNFKSFKDLELELGNFNILIGANASGKSNFIQIFKFLKDIARDGLDNAISMQGGVEYLRNTNIGSNENLSLEVVSDQKYGGIGKETKAKVFIGPNIYETIYKFGIKFKRKEPGFEIVEDKLIQKCNFVALNMQKKEIGEKESLGPGEIIFTNVKGRVKVYLKSPEGVSIKREDIIPPSLKIGRKTLLLEALPFFILSPIFSNNSIFDFDPKLPKKATTITGKAELEEDGNNLAIVLKNIIENKEAKRKFSNLVRDLLPFVVDLGVEKFADKSLLFKLQEIYAKKQYLPAFLISDGTVNIFALIIALYFEKKRVTIIEEPERNIHPYLISKVVNMMKEASGKKQIIVTTHNPEVVKHAGLENIFLISRDKKGFSTISKPVEKEEIKIFLENELGIEELYVQDLLGI